MKTLEQRIAQAERLLKVFVRRGRKYRTEFREQIEILIHTQMRDNDEWRARHRAMDEKINILINAQIATDEQLKRTDQQIEALTASHAKTEEALERFLNGLSKGRNGNSSD